MLVTAGPSIGPGPLLTGAARAGGSVSGATVPLYARRDTPEIILPTLAAPISKNIGSNDVLSASYSQIVAATGQALSIVGAYMTYRAGAVTASGFNGTVIQARQGRIALATGAAGAEVPFAQYRFGHEETVTVSNAGATTVCQGFGLADNFYAIGPRQFPAGTRLSYNGAYNDAIGEMLIQMYLAAIDPTAVTIVTLSPKVSDYVKGTAASDTRWTDYALLASSAAIWTFPPAFTTLTIEGAAADRDYLVIDAFINLASANVNIQVDLAIGAAGAEVIQARVANPSFLALAYGVFNAPLFMPFVLHAGERLSARQANSAAAINIPFTATLIRL